MSNEMIPTVPESNGQAPKPAAEMTAKEKAAAKKAAEQKAREDKVACEKALKAYVDLHAEKQTIKAREAALAQTVFTLIGSGKIVLGKSGLEISAIRKRESLEGVEPIVYSYYMKHYGETAPKNSFDV